MGVATRHCLVPDSVHVAATRQAAAAGLSLQAWTRDALEAWIDQDDPVQARLVADAEQLSAAQTPASPALPPSSVADLQTLARDPRGTRLNLWLALLTEARWPVPQVASPVLDLTPRSVAKRVRSGQRTLNDAEDLGRLLARLPLVPDCPDFGRQIPGPGTDGELVGLTLRLEEDLLRRVTRKAALSQAVRAAIRDRLTFDGVEDRESRAGEVEASR